MLGKIDVQLHYNYKSHDDLKLFVLRGNGVNLLGRSWLNVTKLDWNSVIKPISNVHTTEVIDASKRLASLLKNMHRFSPIDLGK